MNSAKRSSKDTKRIVRLGGFALLVGLTAYLVIQSIMAWGFAYLLTHPLCERQAETIAGLPPKEKVILVTEDGLEITAWYYPPQHGVLILALGGTCGALGDTLPPVKFLLQAGYGVLQIDSRANASPRGEVTLGGKEVLDIEAGIKFLETRPEVETIGALGYSMGGVSVIRAAKRHPQISAVVAEGGYYNLGDDITEPGTPKSIFQQLFLRSTAWAFWANSGINPWEISPIDDLPLISPRPVLLIYGEAEADSGHAQAQYQAAKKPKELWIIPGGAHGKNYAVAQAEYERGVLDFFERYLFDR